MKPRLIRASYFVWIVFPIAFYALYLMVGLPHFIWAYEWRNTGQGHDPFANRHYTSCTYIGPYGAFTTSASADGKCNWFRFRKKRGDV